MSAAEGLASAPATLTPALAAEIRRVFDLQGAATPRLRRCTVDERVQKLRRLRAEVIAQRDAILHAAYQDFRRPPAEAEFTELMTVIMDISDHCKHLRKWLRPRKVRPTAFMLGTQAWVHLEPRGRCLIIAPWNYPLTLTLGPLIPAIACGNAAMVKTSEVAPHLSAVLARIIRTVFDESEVAVFEGDASVATALLDLPFDHCFFTGAPAIGKIVMSAAARHLSSVTLELGGKSPVIVDETADLELAARTLAWAKTINSGQTCIAPDHIYVHSSVKDRLVELFRRHLNAWYGEGAAARDSTLTRIINARHAQRVADLLDDARQRGATILYGGDVDVSAHFVSPTLIGDIPADAKIMREEIFGPLLPIIGFDSLGEVIAQISAGPKPLAMYIWSRSDANARHLIDNTSAGGTCINHVAAQFLHHNLPFGGVNNSGIGSYHGEWGIRAFSHERAVVKTRVMLAKLFFPPYTQTVRRILDWVIRHF